MLKIWLFESWMGMFRWVFICVLCVVVSFSVFGLLLVLGISLDRWLFIM